MLQQRNMWRRWWFVMVAIGVVLTLGRSETSIAAGTLALPVGFTVPDQPTSMPDFRLPGVGGTTLGAADLHGKVALVRFWATW